MGKFVVNEKELNKYRGLRKIRGRVRKWNRNDDNDKENQSISKRSINTKSPSIQSLKPLSITSKDNKTTTKSIKTCKRNRNNKSIRSNSRKSLKKHLS